MLRFNSFLFVFAVLLCFFSNSVKSEFPTDPKPCAYSDSACLVNIIKYFMTEKSSGDSSINLVPIDPLKITGISIKQGAESPVNIDLSFMNNEVVGIQNVDVIKTKGFGKDLTEKHEVHFKFKNVSLLGDYKITGRVLVLPIRGNGKANMTLIDIGVILKFSGTPVEKSDGIYMQTHDMRMELIPGRLWYNFENLFNGEKELSDNMNLFLNENWRDIFDEVKDSLGKAFSKVFESVVNTVFDKYPYEKYFKE